MADGRWNEEGRYERAGWRNGSDGWVSYFNEEGFLILRKKDILIQKQYIFYINLSRNTSSANFWSHNVDLVPLLLSPVAGF